ncbi:hypothetical protein OS125_11525 [Corynebacterium sp. P7003]|uniref:Uncharacterized protein n=1 Tax=Corynebacterium pygosceleis TaxID=2800406 RepID=A0ABT3X0S9_9CORY|nr:hypothetical protein [Corynebacterium pygosceleis]MCX7445861.1 hypothetical protein [Corynebacterium pygosceleis]
MPDYMYRAHIVEQPEYELREVWRTRPVETETGWHDSTDTYYTHVPAGWYPHPGYVERFKTTDWIQPDTRKWFKSRSSAAERVAILESAGYTAIVQRSSPITWPEDGEKRVEVSEGQKIRDAINTLVAAGLISGADELFRR